ncbi:hypothetical protein J3F83DRAFT_252704 [Trichoderma novae-zelandiae]
MLCLGSEMKGCRSVAIQVCFLYALFPMTRSAYSLHANRFHILILTQMAERLGEIRSRQFEQRERRPKQLTVARHSVYASSHSWENTCG